MHARNGNSSNDNVAAEGLLSPVARLRLSSDRRLGQRLLPEDPNTSPYEVREYDSLLTLHDAKGIHATFHRRQTIRFLQNGASAVLDHFWGDGVGITNYSNSAGPIEESVRDRDRTHLVIGLPRRMERGELLKFEVEREAMVAFTGADEWLETTIDHPVQNLRIAIAFPKDRSCKKAVLTWGKRVRPVPIKQLRTGATLVRVRVRRPQEGVPYTLRWSW